MSNPLSRFKAGLCMPWVVLMMVGCGTAGDLRRDAMKVTTEASKAPSEAPYWTVTNFSNAVRCMDGMFLTFGIRDVSILLEDLEDQTKKSQRRHQRHDADNLL